MQSFDHAMRLVGGCLINKLPYKIDHEKKLVPASA